jgi:hypothetical protein
MIVPALLACGPGRGDGVARQQPVQVIVDDDPFVERGQSLISEARRLDGLAGREESLAQSSRMNAETKRQNASALRQQARLSEGSTRETLLARAEAMETEAVAMDARGRVFSKRGKLIRSRASEVRALARHLVNGEQTMGLAALTLPAPPSTHTDPFALRTLPAISSDGTIVVARMDHHMKMDRRMMVMD